MILALATRFGYQFYGCYDCIHRHGSSLVKYCLWLPKMSLVVIFCEANPVLYRNFPYRWQWVFWFWRLFLLIEQLLCLEAFPSPILHFEIQPTIGFWWVVWCRLSSHVVKSILTSADLIISFLFVFFLRFPSSTLGVPLVAPSSRVRSQCLLLKKAGFSLAGSHRRDALCTLQLFLQEV